jgi:uncharacterized protein YbjT (DUF2867 family)
VTADRINQTTTPILVTGGTGTLGRQVVDRLRAQGRTVRVLARHAPPSDDGLEFRAGDLATGEGIDAAFAGVETVLHLAGGPKGDDEKARHLVDAAGRAGIEHVVYISVVGADRIPIVSAIDRGMFGYFGYKLAAERIIAESELPWTTLRATQFHDLMLKTVAGMAKMPIVPVPSGWRVQPIDSGDVADRLVELMLGAPAGLVPEIGGPRVYRIDELLRSYLDAIGKHRLILRIPLPGAAFRATRAGANLTPERAVGRRTWEEFLAERVGSPAARSNPLTQS